MSQTPKTTPLEFRRAVLGELSDGVGYGVSIAMSAAELEDWSEIYVPEPGVEISTFGKD